MQNNDQPSTSGSHDKAQVQQVQDQQVASSSQVNQSSDQAQVLQLVHIARDHPLDQIVEEVHDVEFDETKGSQDEDENLYDVRGT